MPSIDIPTLGTLVLAAVLVSAAFTIALSMAAAGGRPHLLPSVRYSTLATIALVACAVFLLAYAFQAHDFRIRYVARYSDRSMPAAYLWAALWGGQDGSLLWWSFLLSGYTGLFVWWVKDKYRELQPVMLGTLMCVLSFFMILMLFAANPFATTYGPPPPDGEGLNPLLQNYWMVIHPPALYLGLTGWSVPFAFVMAALVTGRLHEEWIHAARRWVLLAWGFLSLGNMLGMFWSYEELGWGGYWAWDPVENASFLPWLTGTAYLHSVMIQERRGILKVWNVFLLSSTFILTIFGTFLTRSGLIASVHSFARSDLGGYFLVFLGFLIVTTFVLIGWRLVDLRGGARLGPVSGIVAALVGVLIDGVLLFSSADLSWWHYALFEAAPLVVIGLLKVIEIVRIDVLSIPPQSNVRPKGIESLLSREFAFLFNNWILLAMMVFVLVATTFPLISAWLRDQTVTLAADFYNQWMIPMGLILLFLCGVGPLIAWRKATGSNLLRAFLWPSVSALTMFLAHFFLGALAGFPPFVAWAEMYPTWTGQVLAAIYSVAPICATTLAAFVFGTVTQEFTRGTLVRKRSSGESIPVAFFQLVSKARRRYGGYVVHLGVVLMFLGFTGAAYDVEAERSLRPGQSMSAAGYEFRFDELRQANDPNKHMVFGEMTILRDGQEWGRVSPAKFVYRTHPSMPTTEVDIVTTARNDLYVIMANVDPDEDRATFRVIVRPLVVWIWLGGALFLIGVFISGFPKLGDLLESASERAPVRAVAALLLAFVLGSLFAPSLAEAQDNAGSSSLHAGTVEIHDPNERRLFERLLCECGDCQRLPLDTCACPWAEGMRAELRGRIARGDEVNAIIADYRERFGPASIAIPSDAGLERALWALPIAGILIAAGAIVWRVRRSTRASQPEPTFTGNADASKAYDERLEEELRSLDQD